MRHASTLLAALAIVSVTSVAAASGPRDLPVNDIFDEAGKLIPLRSGATYGASLFPVAVRVTPRGSWTGAQWKANIFAPQEIKRRHLHCPYVCKPPYYGWVAIGKGGTSSTHPPSGLILVMTGYTRTPSVATTVANLQRDRGATYEPPTQVKLAGLTATQFAGRTVTTKGHLFRPFSSANGGATGSNAADGIQMDGAGHPFRFTVLNVRGKTVVVLVGSLVLPAGQFQAFLPKADAVLKTLSFPS